MIVSNSTPLINFAAIQRLDILEQLFATIYIPAAVKQEVLVKGAAYNSADEIRNAAFIRTMSIRNVALFNSLRMDLDDGEAEAITLALEQDAELVLLDEAAGRKTAKFHNLTMSGSIGCLATAKQQGLITEIKPILNMMQDKARYWLSKSLYQHVLLKCDELG